ncbi:hypothetical protein [Providencia sp. PROV134]|uniref:hypothetical protein n=1 Tax=Providencia sp. PROV134 TaxID=2949844 RepID=UPI002349B0BB|nr:hypothetical protein [Providencia sp. PROV134]
MDKSRQQFEAFVNDGDFPWLKASIPIMWMVWKASRESLEVELPDSIGYSKEYRECDCEEGYRKGYNNSLSECRQALISNGVKIKNE